MIERSGNPGPTLLATPTERRLARAAVVSTLLLLVLRLLCARGLGFGDAEALYASYALHPQPAYLDHPGLIGVIARWLGDAGGAPSPGAAHAFTAIAATAIPWIGGWSARAAGAEWAGTWRVVIALALVPELSIGLFALAPDLPLAAAWLGALGLAAWSLRRPPHEFRTLLATLGVGVLVGLACLAKISGVLLGMAILAAFLSGPARARWRTLAPWSALGVALVLVAPVVTWEIGRGFPMLQHRLIATQHEAGFSFRNAAALLGGQLLYLTPFFLIAVYWLARGLWSARREGPVFRLLWLATIVPAIPLALLCLWSKVAEPHWLAPAYLGLALYFGLVGLPMPKLKVACVASGLFVAALAYAWVKTPLPLRLLGSSYRPRYDLANDLYAWGPGRQLLSQAVRQAILDSQQLPVVVGPHWTVCAQVHAALGHAVPVGCNSPMRDDFDDWLPRSKWLSAPVILFVTDDRFPAAETGEFPNRSVRGVSRTEVMRDGRAVRSIRITRLDKSSDIAQSRGDSCGRRASALTCLNDLR